MNSPLVTVYVPCRNYGHFLVQCVESVFAQLYARWELVIIDEGSDDDTPQIAEQLRLRRPEQVTVLRNEQPIGLQRVANRVLGMANGRYLMRLDADDWLDEGALLLMVAKLEADSALGLIYGNYFYVDLEGNVLGMERRYKLGAEDASGHLPPHGACTMVRTRALKAVGGYSEDVNAQDGWELWYKLKGRVRAANLEVPLFYYRQHGNSLSRNFERLLAARSRIFERVGRALDGSYRPTCTAVIPVRESYPGFDGVPYREHEGSSLLERAILSATSAENVTSVMVSSESQRVLDFAATLEESGRVPPHSRVLRTLGRRPVPQAVPIREILLHAGQSHRTQHGTFPDMITFLSIHAVRRRAEHVDKALRMLRITESDSVVSVQEEREPVFSHGTDGLRLLNPGRFHALSYDRERLYRFNGAILAAWWDIVEGTGLLGEKVAYIEMSPQDSLQIKDPTMLGAAAAGSPPMSNCRTLPEDAS